MVIGPSKNHSWRSITSRVNVSSVGIVATYNAGPKTDTFLPLLDWAFFAVHNGDLDSRDNVGLRAIWDWTREGVAWPALERYILAGNDAELLKRMGYDPEVPLENHPQIALRVHAGDLDPALDPLPLPRRD